MNKTDYQLLMECYDQMNDILVEISNDCWNEPDKWDELAKSRHHLLKSRSILLTLLIELIKP